MLLWPSPAASAGRARTQQRWDLILSCDDVFNYLATFRTKCVVKGGKAQRTAKMIRGKVLR